MVQTFTTNEKNDIYVDSSGSIAISRNLQGALQACENVSLAQLGEEVLTKNNGVPNFQAVWVGNQNLQLFSAFLNNVLLTVPSVQAVQNIELRPQNNTLGYSATIQTQFGTGEVSNG